MWKAAPKQFLLYRVFTEAAEDMLQVFSCSLVSILASIWCVGLRVRQRLRRFRNPPGQCEDAAPDAQA